MADNVKVAVRCRPFNQREQDRQAKCIISMNGQKTTITNPENGDSKDFTFDYSYWSHDSNDSSFAGQEAVFKDLGLGVLANAWEGYNCSLFAYGQTGSGKSYSMVGYGEQLGIIPLVCKEMFQRIEANDSPDVTFAVEASMIEIYNERVRDLFNPKNPGNASGLKVREHPKQGPYVDSLSTIAVRDYAHIDMLMEQGTQARTVASTNMNATSSRAHTIFTITFKQTKVDSALMKATDKTSKINLVDLAGSERAASTGAQGARLKEGAAINKSLSALGNCISALAENSGGKKKHVPYRDSVLTRLLQQSLGGNAKTIMIAALSPADINYEETLSTLRYADRAKQIKNVATVNEDPNERLIRELREEIERLRRQATGEADAELAQELSAYKEKVQATEIMMEMMKKEWEEKLQAAAKADVDRSSALAEMGIVQGSVDKSVPQLVNISEDPMRSGALIYYLDEGSNIVGRPDGSDVHIKLSGVQMKPKHCDLVRNDREVTIHPFEGAKIFVNGKVISEATVVQQSDRLIFAGTHIFRFNDPVEAEKRAKEREQWLADHPDEVPDLPMAMDWEFAQREVMKAQFGGKLGEGSNDDADVQAKLKELEAKYKLDQEARQKEWEEKMKQLNDQSSSDKEGELQRRLEDQRRQLQEEFERQQKEAEARMAEEKRVAELDAKRKAKAAEESLQEHVAVLLPMISEVNEICTVMDKEFEFEVVIMPKVAFPWTTFVPGEENNESEVAVKCLDKYSNSTAFWPQEKFEDRFYLIRDAYAQFQNSGEWDSGDEDPFYDAPEDRVIGHCRIYAETLFHLMEIDQTSKILDFKGKQEGLLAVKMQIMDIEGKEFDDEEEDAPDSLEELDGKDVKFSIQINSASGLPHTDQHFFVRFTIPALQKPVQTPRSEGSTTKPEWNYTKLLPLRVDKDLIAFFKCGMIHFEVLGEPLPRPKMPVENAKKKAEKELAEKQQRIEEREEQMMLAVQKAEDAAKERAGTTGLIEMEEEEMPDSPSINASPSPTRRISAESPTAARARSSASTASEEMQKKLLEEQAEMAAKLKDLEKKLESSESKASALETRLQDTEYLLQREKEKQTPRQSESDQEETKLKVSQVEQEKKHLEDELTKKKIEFERLERERNALQAQLKKSGACTIL